jgi:hypothetical protein
VPAPRGESGAVEPAQADRTTAPPPPTLDEVKALTPASDFSRFVAPGVDAEVKNAAMKKLFADPHFNVMDGLDTYIEDYGRADPIPKAMLRQMVQARVLGLLDDELEEQPQPADLAARDATVPLPVVAGPEPEPVTASADTAALPAVASEDPPASAELVAAPAPPPPAA